MLNPKSQDALVAAGVVRRKRDGVRLIGTGELTAKVQISIAGATKSSIAAVKKAGGTITVRSPVEKAGEPKKKGKSKEVASAVTESEAATAAGDGGDATTDDEK